MTEQSPAEAIFFSALEKGTLEERAAYLDAVCREDSGLRRRVERLLEAHPKAGGFLEPTAAYVPGAEEAGTVIAERYKLLEQIGEGGMGAVWVAEQTQPVRRKVALKLIKAGMDSHSVLARFEAERQALAVMDHPNVAKVLDGGLTESGRPFFVMEYVKGVPITEYCDATRLSVHERLQLFAQVCQAVQHAHQKGIIHRDLKPSNILVAPYDDKPVPKIIDFGLAKAMNQSLTERTLHTAHGTVLGTPLYMSPEQAQLNNLDVDTRSDIYSLGVLLYELLTGTTPLEKKRFKEAAWDEVRRIIREEEPPRPSTRLSSTDTLPSLAACRHTEPLKLTRQIRGDLDWIVMKALEKDRTRRYETANGFAADVQRHLAGEPVQAHPPSTAYRLKKFVRRHKGPVLAGTLLVVALLLGVIGTSIGLVLADTARRRAESAEQNARDGRQKVDAARRAAERTAASLQIDLDLNEIQDDARLGLLRLARTLKGLPADVQELREFATVGILAVGQAFAPLLPPITHDGYDVTYEQLSPDARTLLTLGADRTARLWDTPTARPVAILRRGDERVVNCAISPDSRTVATDSEDGVLRFWDLPNGTFRAQSEPRPDRYGKYWLSNKMDRLIGDLRLSASRVVTQRYLGEEPDFCWTDEPLELWDSATGKRIARLELPDRDLNPILIELFGQKQPEDLLGLVWNHVQFAAQGRWITANAGRSTVVVFSSDDGRVLGRLTHPPLGPEDRGPYVLEPPSSRLLVTKVARREAKLDRWNSEFYFWEQGTWRRLPGVVSMAPKPGLSDPDHVWARELNEDLLLIVDHFDWRMCRPRDSESLAGSGSTEVLTPLEGLLPEGILRGESLLAPNGMLFNMRTGQRVIPPAGRRFHADLAQFAPDSRFVAHLSEDQVSIIDVITDKRLVTRRDDTESGPWAPLAYRPGFGMIGMIRSIFPEFFTHTSRSLLHTSRFLVIPTLPPEIAPDLLELWAQVAVRGEIGTDGNFAKWDESMGERKRQELAARPVPPMSFPFPGHVATDRLHWLRGEFDAAESDADQLRVAKQLLDRAEAAGDKVEAARWRAIAGSKADPPQK
ncbi:MAG TPA: serine/threonine-protein kinase [Pirellulales bacterium]|nr:serine/threonine-protein kinase [Pirellulales bacterium]